MFAADGKNGPHLAAPCRTMPVLTAAGALMGVALLFGGALIWLRTHLTDSEDALVDAIDALLPQTQCAQCGYVGCRPYAQAVAQGEALNLCPPGGLETFTALRTLLGRDDDAFPNAPHPTPLIARVREPECIGCFLCIRACPVDAIIGAPGFMHTVIEDRCTGCELCLPACPTDCIDLLPVPNNAEVAAPPAPSAGTDAQAPCIGCNRCEPVCPANLPPQHLLRLVRAEQLDRAASAGLSACIECRLCDRACPSNIPLAGLFRQAKGERKRQATRIAQASAAKARDQARRDRLARAEANADARRAKRMAEGAPRRW